MVWEVVESLNLEEQKHLLASEEVIPDPEKNVRAAEQMDRPENKLIFQTVLGFIQFLNMLVQNLSEESEPLRSLLEKPTQ